VCLVQLPGATVEASSLHSADKTSAATWQHHPLDAAALATLIHQTPAAAAAAAAAAGHQAGWASPATWSYSQARRQDAIRRDFTINALLYDPFSRLLFDYVGGWQDLQQRVVRCVGDPSSSFQADPTRMLRGLRCASRSGEQLPAPALTVVL
jgi:peptidoglycan/xylan/chitin deacetylase (PgdA/CDA1 family)